MTRESGRYSFLVIAREQRDRGDPVMRYLSLRDNSHNLDPGVKKHPTKTFVFAGAPRPRMTKRVWGPRCDKFYYLDPGVKPQDDKRGRGPCAPRMTKSAGGAQDDKEKKPG